jgi:hypothetical protein
MSAIKCHIGLTGLRNKKVLIKYLFPLTYLRDSITRGGLSTETIGVLYSLGLNNPPRICFTPRKSRVKNVWRNKQVNCRCKMAGAGIRSFGNNFLANRYQVECGLLSSALRLPGIHTVTSGLWQSALKSNLDSFLWQSAWRLFYSW